LTPETTRDAARNPGSDQQLALKLVRTPMSGGVVVACKSSTDRELTTKNKIEGVAYSSPSHHERFSNRGNAISLILLGSFAETKVEHEKHVRDMTEMQCNCRLLAPSDCLYEGQLTCNS
jgi:hypothetical protein